MTCNEPPNTDLHLPFDTDLPIAKTLAPIKPSRYFSYVGMGYTAGKFTSYVNSLKFTTKPDYIVLHHTASPGTRVTGAYSNGWIWDANETKLSALEIYRKRQKQLGNIRNYYQNTLGWDRGPHLFIDERYIWVFTPLNQVGIHAGSGNSRTVGGTFHYSIGIEVVGYYEYSRWNTFTERLVGHAVAVLKKRLGTFDYTYKRWEGGISSHRDYGKPMCPGKAITEDYYLNVLQRGWDLLFL